MSAVPRRDDRDGRSLPRGCARAGLFFRLEALDAYHASLKGRPAPILDGTTGDQRVFLGWAQAHSRKSRPEGIRKQTASNPPSYSKFRVDGVVRNIDDWYSASGIKPGDPLYIPPEKRARVW